MRDVLRDYLKVAADTATGVVVVVDGARKRAEDELRGRVPEPVQEVVAGVVGVVRTEADRAWSRLGDGMVQVGVVLEFLEQQIRQLQGAAVSRPVDEAEEQAESSRPASARAEAAFPSARHRAAARPVRVVVDEDPELAAAAERRRAAVPGMKKAAERRAAATAFAEQAGSPAGRPVATEPTPAKKATATARKTPAKKAPAKKAPARRTPAADAPVKQTAAKKTAAKKAVAKKAPAETAVAAKTAPAKTAPAKKTAAQPTAARKTAEKPVVARKTAAKRTPAKKAQPKQPGTGDD